MDGKVFWVDRLCPASVMELVRLRLKGQQIREIRYLSASARVLSMTRRLRLAGSAGCTILPVSFSLGDMRSPDGISLRLRVEKDTLNLGAEILDEIRAIYPVAPLARMGFPQAMIDSFVDKALAEAVHPAVMLAHVARWYLRNQAGSHDRDYVLLTESPWDSYLRNQTAGQGLTVLGYLGAARRYPIFHFISVLLRSTVRLVRTLAYPYLMDRRDHVRRQSTRPVIAVQYADGADLQVRSDFFWYPGSGLAPEQMLIYFDRTDAPATRENTALIQGLGFDWVAVRSGVSAIPDTPLWRPGRSYAMNAFRELVLSASLGLGSLTGRSAEKLWLWEQTHSMRQAVVLWEGFFRAHNAKAHIHTIDTGPLIVAQALAMERAGGISVGYHWSHYYIVASDHSRPQDVYFSWGPHYETIMRQERSTIGHLAFSGYLTTNCYKHASSEPADRALRDRGARYVICIFDSSYSEVTPYSEEMFKQFYEAFLRELLEDRHLGMIIKPKRIESLANIAGLTDLLERAVSTGRCVALAPEYSPSLAARGSDIAVGLGINSAVIEAVLSGIPGAHCDLTCNSDNPFYSWGKGRVVFDDFSSLILALRRHRLDPKQAPFLGDHGPVLREIDPFQDGKGAERLGRYLCWLMSGLEQGASRENALSAANDKYRKHFGAEMLVPIGRELRREGVRP